jgi:hypothetical protein
MAFDRKAQHGCWIKIGEQAQRENYFSARTRKDVLISTLSGAARHHPGTSKNRRERRKFGSRSATVRRYGEHRNAEIAPRSRSFEVPCALVAG